MAVLGKDIQQPNERLDWDIDWGDWLAEGEYLEDVEILLRLRSGDEAPALHCPLVQITRSLSKVWLIGGAHGARWRVQVRALTTGGRRKEAEFDLAIKEI